MKRAEITRCSISILVKLCNREADRTSILKLIVTSLMGLLQLVMVTSPYPPLLLGFLARRPLRNSPYAAASSLIHRYDCPQFMTVRNLIFTHLLSSQNLTP